MSKKTNADIVNGDRRIIARKLLAGELNEKDLHGMLKKLPDLSENAEEMTIQMNDK
ncbi:MAG: hypothetical protein R6W75_08050 [Smithellaceae bacterium]